MIRLACGLALLLAMNSLAAPAEKAKIASTPEEALELYGKAWMSKKPNDRYEYLIQPFREAVEISEMIDAAYQKVAEAAEKKFPTKLNPEDGRDLASQLNSHRPPMPWFTRDSNKLLKLEVVQKKAASKDQFFFLVREKRHGIHPNFGGEPGEFTQQRLYRASKEKGRWKLFPSIETGVVEEPQAKNVGQPDPLFAQGVRGFHEKPKVTLEGVVLADLELEFKKELAKFEGLRTPFDEQMNEAKRLNTIGESIVREIAQGKYRDAAQAKETFNFYRLAPPELTREEFNRFIIPKESKPTDSGERRAMLAKHTAAVAWLDGLILRVNLGKDPLAVLLVAQHEFLQVNLDLSENDDDRLKALLLSVYFTREIEELTQALFDAGSRGKQEVAQVQVQRYNAELAVIRFKAKMKK